MNGFTRRQAIATGAALAGGLALPSARAAGYPERDITFISPWSAGGGLDVILRVFCKQMETVLKGNINLENRVGASGTIGTAMLVRAKPDGYTVGYGGSNSLVMQPLILKGLTYKGVEDLTPIIMINSMPTLLVVKADSPLKTFADFLKEVKAKPNQVRVALAGLGTSADMELQQISKVANLKIRGTPFSGGTSEVNLAILGGRVEAGVGTTEGVKPHVESGGMRVLAVFKSGKYEPFPTATPVPDIPEFANVTMLPSTSWFCAPKGIPQDIFQKLYTSARQVITSEEFKAFGRTAGLVIDPSIGPEQIVSESKRLTAAYTEILKYMADNKSS